RGDVERHPLRRLPERLPGVPQVRRRRVRARLLRSDGRRTRPPARARARPPARVLALRRLHGGLPGQDPAARAPARAAARPRRRPRGALARARRVHALVVRLVDPARLPTLDHACPRGSAARAALRARVDAERRPRAPEAPTALPGPPVIEEFAERAAQAGFTVHRDEIPELEGAEISYAAYAL